MVQSYKEIPLQNGNKIIVNQQGFTVISYLDNVPFIAMDMPLERIKANADKTVTVFAHLLHEALLAQPNTQE